MSLDMAWKQLDKVDAMGGVLRKLVGAAHAIRGAGHHPPHLNERVVNTEISVLSSAERDTRLNLVRDAVRKQPVVNDHFPCGLHYMSIFACAPSTVSGLAHDNTISAKATIDRDCRHAVLLGNSFSANAAVVAVDYGVHWYVVVRVMALAAWAIGICFRARRCRSERSAVLRPALNFGLFELKSYASWSHLVAVANLLKRQALLLVKANYFGASCGIFDLAALGKIPARTRTVQTWIAP